MDKMLETFIELNRSSLQGEISSKLLSNSEAVDWEQIYQLSVKRGTVLLCSNMVAKLAELGKVPEDVAREWGQYCSERFAYELIKWGSIRKLLEKASKSNVQLIMFKGYVLAQLYPGFGVRNSSDIDFLVREEEIERVKELLADEYELIEEHSKEKVFTYRNKMNGQYIEIHMKLWEDYTGKKIEILEQCGLDAPDSIRLCTLYGGQQVLTLGITEQLIYQIFHIVKHFCVEGIGIRYLIDVSLYCNHYFEQVDWEQFWKACDRLQYTEFCRQIFSLGIRYFGMNRDVLDKTHPYLEQIDGEEEFLGDLMLGGFVSEGQKGSYQILGIMTPYLTGELDPAASKQGRLLQTLFPSADCIREDFAYAKRHRFLLPVAWVHRFIDYTIYRIRHPKESYGVGEKLSSAEYRIEQLKKRGLV